MIVVKFPGSQPDRQSFSPQFDYHPAALVLYHLPAYPPADGQLLDQVKEQIPPPLAA